MRKAFTVSAIALASSMALAAPATAFAADTVPPSPTPSASQSSQSSQDTQDTQDTQAALSLGQTTAAPGDQITVTVTAPAGSTAVAVSSKALGDIALTENDGTWTGTATVAKVDDGNYGVALTGVSPSGAMLQASANLTVKGEAPKPQASLGLSADSGAPGAKVDIVIRPGDLQGDAYVTSDAFGGRVGLSKGEDGSWHGTATVKGQERSYYGVTGYVGSTKVDTVKFTVTEGQSKPVVGKSEILLGKTSGKSGDKVDVTVNAPSIGPNNKLDVSSMAFGGHVRLTQGKDGKWHGTATVAKVKNGTYDVSSAVAKSVHFTVKNSNGKHHHHTNGHHSNGHSTTPGHQIPKGAVDTGMAPVAAESAKHAGLGGLMVGTATLGAAALAAAVGLRRRRNHG